MQLFTSKQICQKKQNALKMTFVGLAVIYKVLVMIITVIIMLYFVVVLPLLHIQLIIITHQITLAKF